VKKIGFIGGGNMAEALIAGLLAARTTTPTRLAVCDPLASRCNSLKKKYRIRIAKNNTELVKQVEVILLAIKPQVMKQVLGEIAPAITTRHLIISIAAGIDTGMIRRHLGSRTRIIRTMPNTPALIGQGITGLYATPAARPADRKGAEAIFTSVGDVVPIERERDLDWVTALSGSGPAYLFYFLESLAAAGTRGGLSQTVSRQLALATVRGAAALAAQSGEDFKTLRTRVTSKGGTTEAALKVLKKKKWSQSLEQAVRAAAKKGQTLRKGQ